MEWSENGEGLRFFAKVKFNLVSERNLLRGSLYILASISHFYSPYSATSLFRLQKSAGL